MGLETTISENGTAIFGRSGPTSQRGPLLEVDYFDRKIPPGPNRSIYVCTEISGNFGIMAITLGLHCSALAGKILVFGLGCVCWGGWERLSLNKRWSHMEVRLF